MNIRTWTLRGLGLVVLGLLSTAFSVPVFAQDAPPPRRAVTPYPRERLVERADPGPGFLRTKGQTLVNDRGPVVLRGVNLANWLHLEGYLLAAQKPAQQGQTGYLNSLTELLGNKEKTAVFLDRLREVWITRQDIDTLASLGYNHLRLPLHRDLFINPETGEELEEGFYWIDRLLEWCRPHGLYIIPDLHAAPGGQNSNHVSDSDGTARFWTDFEKNLGATKRIWYRLALRYAAEPLIGGWDLLNEPEVAQGKEKLRQAYLEITKTIRSVDTRHMIIAEGNWFSTSFWELISNPQRPSPRDAWDTNLVFSFHSYWTDIPNPALKDQLRMAAGAQVPVWLGEFGENSNTWIARQVADMEARGIGWSFWCYKKVEAISGLVDVAVPPSYRKILDYWKGGPQPSPEETWEGLEDLLAAAQGPNTLFRSDVAAALEGQKFLDRTLPWQIIQVPADVPAMYYDRGTQGMAYKDQEFQASTYPAQAWNLGWGFRNDGVDLRETEPGGWIVISLRPGEFLTYTLEFPDPGPFEVVLRYAAPEEGCRVQLSLGPQSTPPVLLPGTGGWEVFQDVSLGVHTLVPGRQTLKVDFLTGGLDFSLLRIRRL